MYALKTKKSNNKKRWLILGASIAVVLILGVLTWRYFNSRSKHEAPTGTVINYGPPTDEEKQAGDNKKQEIVNQQSQSNNSSTNSGQKKQVTLTITSASASGVSAYITGIFEEGGGCTATFTKGNEVVTKTSGGFGNASYTQCAPFQVSPSDFPSKGSWTLTVNYSSATAEGKSQPQQVEVQ